MSDLENDPTEPSFAGLLRDLSILIIEDENIVAFDLNDLLLDHGARFTMICTSVASARIALKNKIFHAVILDLKLTDGSGLSLLPLIHSLGLPMIITSGYPPMEIDQIPFVHKPYSAETLVSMLNSAICGR